MGYTEETTTQMSLFPEEKITTTKQASIPVYRVSLIREGQLPSYESRIVIYDPGETFVEIKGHSKMI